MWQRARLAHARHPDLGEISAHCFYATKLRFGDLAFDVGANRGEHAALMLRRGARVVAVEPQTKLAAELERRLPSATVVPAAVSDKPGHASLHLVSTDNRLASLDASFSRRAQTTPVAWDGTERVRVTTLDTLIAKYGKPVLLKLDTEGFEHHALRGLSWPIQHILFEVHAALQDEAAAAFDRLNQLGSYEWRLARGNTWLFGSRQPQEAIIKVLPDWGNIYARFAG